jgi:hypothetical protein
MSRVVMVSERDIQPSSMLDYYVTVRRKDNGEFVAGYRFEGYSGHAMMDEVKYLRETFEKNIDYPVTIEW